MYKSDYVIYYPIGKGGQGTVYLAYSKVIKKYVCIKEIEKGVAEERKAVQLMKRIEHPQFPKIIDEYEAENKYYYVMEYINGTSLLSYPKKFSVSKTIDVGLQLIEMLDDLKRNDITYNDLKPDNILISELGLIHIVDYGAVLCVGDTTSKRYGSFQFSSPEYIHKKKVDWRSDLYSIGKILVFICNDSNKRLLKWINKACNIDVCYRFASIIEAYNQLKKVNRRVDRFGVVVLMIISLILVNGYRSLIYRYDINTKEKAILFHSLDCYWLLKEEFKYNLSTQLMNEQQQIYWIIQEKLCFNSNDEELRNRSLFLKTKSLEGLILTNSNLQFYMNYLIFLEDEHHLSQAYFYLNNLKQNDSIQKVKIEIAFYLKKDDWLINDFNHCGAEMKAYSLFRLFQLGNYNQGYLHQAVELLKESNNVQLIHQIIQAINQWGEQS